MSDENVNIGVQYGALVVGQEEAARQARVREITSSQTYGTLVLGDEKAAELATLVAAGKAEIEQPAPSSAPSFIPPPNAGTELTGEETHLAPPPERTTPSYSLEQVSAVLADQPEMLDTLVEAEMARPEGPRRQAVETFVVSAEAQGRDADFLDALRALVS